MKRTYVLIALSSFALAGGAQTTQEQQAPGQATSGMQQMQTRMQDMQALMDLIHKTADPQERQRLMTQHMQTMQHGMSMMGQMMRAQADAPAPVRECTQGDAECRMQRMQDQQRMLSQRMNMMQMMMEQMMGQMTQRDAEQPPATPDDSKNHETHH